MKKYALATLLHNLARPLACSLALASTLLAADAPKSLLPAFGPEGKEFTANAKDSHKIKGWLPTGWLDNSEWAAVTLSYTKLSDPPKEGITAIRLKVEKADEGQLQLTSFTKFTFKKGTQYVVEGWIRSAQGAGLTLGIRQPGEPYEFYSEKPLEATAEWKRFEHAFTLGEDHEAWVMFYKPEPGVVDLADIVVRVKKD